MASPLIECRDLTVGYGRLTALDRVNLSIEGGAVGLLGPNGAGKSSLIKTILGFIQPVSGSVKLLGRDVAEHAIATRALVGYMAEGTSSIAEMKTWALVAYAGELAGLPRREARERAHEVLNFVGLKEERYREMAGFSTGMQQRVKLALALVHGPHVLFLDEPTNGLDPAGRRELLGLIKDVAERMKIHVLLSSHLLPDVEAVCSQVVVLHKGKVVVSGEIAELRARSRRRFEVWIKGDEGVFKAQLEAHGGELKGQRNDNLLVEVAEESGATAVLKAAAAAGVQLRHLKPVEHTLEEVFLAAIGEGR